MRTTIQRKISIGIACLVFLLILIGNVFMYNYFLTFLREEQKQYDVQAVSAFSKSLESIIGDVQLIAQNISINPVVQDFLQKESKDYYSIENTMNELRNIMRLRMFIRSATIVCGDEVFWSYSPYESYFKQIMREKWYSDIKGKNKVLSDKHTVQIIEPRDHITYIYNIFAANAPTKKIGEILLNIDIEYIERTLYNTVSKHENSMVFNGKNGEVIFNKGVLKPDEIMEIYTVGSTNGIYATEYKSGVLTLEELDKLGWVVAVYTTSERIFAPARAVRGIFMLYIPLTVLAITSAIYIYIRLLTVPITQITDAMLKFAKDKSVDKVDIHTGDELELMGNQFNDMVESIQSYVEQKVEDERVNKKIKFDMLMSKIHPHFLYNTLNTIIHLARNEGNKEIETVTISLIRILQDGMAAYSDKIFAPLSEEMSVIDAYVVIQKYRYKNKFQLNYAVSNEAKKAIIPKNILQPLVENAIFHGIVPMEEQGGIEISAEREENELRICIMDNGVGMPQETLDNLIKNTAVSGNDAHSIGISSIYDRLEYFYKGKYSFEIFSEEEKGTIAVITLPYEV